MTIAILITLTLILVLIVYSLGRMVLWLRTPRELHGDWWKRFERRFRDYERTHKSGAS